MMTGKGMFIMFMSVLSGLIVSVDSFFIGLSLGLQEKCKFWYLAVINAFLFGLCMLGFMIAERVYEHIPFEPDYIVGFAFIGLGLWYILQYFISAWIKRRRGVEESSEEKISLRTLIPVGLVMSGEAMLITMGITFVFGVYSTFAIPITVALAHFGYSALSFFLARTSVVKRMPIALTHVISGAALITYGVMALFVEIGI